MPGIGGPVPQAIHQFTGGGAIHLHRRDHIPAGAGELHNGSRADRRLGEQIAAGPQPQIGHGPFVAQGCGLKQSAAGLIGLLAAQVEQTGACRQLQITGRAADQHRQGVGAAEPTGHQGRGAAKVDAALGTAEAQVGSGSHPEDAAGRGGERGHLQHQQSRLVADREIGGRLQIQVNVAAQDRNLCRRVAAGDAEAAGRGAVTQAFKRPGAAGVGERREHQIAGGLGDQGAGAAIQVEPAVEAAHRTGGSLTGDVDHRGVEGGAEQRFGARGGSQGPGQRGIGRRCTHPEATTPGQRLVRVGRRPQLEVGGRGGRHQRGWDHRLSIQQRGAEAQLLKPLRSSPQHQAQT